MKKRAMMEEGKKGVSSWLERKEKEEKRGKK